MKHDSRRDLHGARRCASNVSFTLYPGPHYTFASDKPVDFHYGNLAADNILSSMPGDQPQNSSVVLQCTICTLVGGL